MLVNKRELTELNHKHLATGGSGGKYYFSKRTPLHPKNSSGKLHFGNFDRMRTYAVEKSENNRRICAAKTYFKVTFLDKQPDTKRKKCSANPL